MDKKDILIDLNNDFVSSFIDKLLIDKTTGENIIFAEDDYITFDKNATKEAQITKEFMDKYGKDYICPRVRKHTDLQSDRTKENAEVFTPSWICNKMNNYLDKDWFEKDNVFNTDKVNTWILNKDKVLFSIEDEWHNYILSKRLEITCGEAPYIVSRYDTTSGKKIPIKRRIGILDRKLRIINENIDDKESWLFWSIKAFKSVYGYEFQGDNLLIARINLFLTFLEYFKFKFNENPSKKYINVVLDIITWNIFQMDGLKHTIPFRESHAGEQMSLFNFEDEQDINKVSDVKIKNWDTDENILFKNIRKDCGSMKFDYVVGNPPYQELKKDTSDSPVYHSFMESAYSISDKTLLITPARFLFNAGKTPKAWNKKILNDNHFTVLDFRQDSSKVFLNTDIKGGVAIHYHDIDKDYGKIGIYSAFSELNSIRKKVNNCNSIMNIITLQLKFDLDALYQDFPELKEKIGSSGRERRLTSNIFKKVHIFSNEKKEDEDIAVVGLNNNKRVIKYINKKYIDQNHKNLYKYKVLLPKSNGSGAIGEVLSTPLVGEPLVGFTFSFISFGYFDLEYEAINAMKYLKSKFARTCLGILKITQDNLPDRWKYVPIQDFTKNSDIDWDVSISEIDQQLYKKYNLSKKEINFIESKVKEMK